MTKMIVKTADADMTLGDVRKQQYLNLGKKKHKATNMIVGHPYRRIYRENGGEYVIYQGKKTQIFFDVE